MDHKNVLLWGILWATVNCCLHQNSEKHWNNIQPLTSTADLPSEGLLLRKIHGKQLKHEEPEDKNLHFLILDLIGPLVHRWSPLTHTSHCMTTSSPAAAKLTRVRVNSATQPKVCPSGHSRPYFWDWGPACNMLACMPWGYFNNGRCKAVVVILFAVVFSRELLQEARVNVPCHIRSFVHRRTTSALS